MGFRIESAKLVRAWRARISVISTFLIGVLFIILSAGVSPEEIRDLGWVCLVFVAVLVLVARPLAVALSTLGSSLKANERAFIAWMAPRGIVAAATSTTFALGLSQAGVGGGAERLVPITFVVIVTTALLYGLSGRPVARVLGFSRTGPGGVLIIGASSLERAIAVALSQRGVPSSDPDSQSRAPEGRRRRGPDRLCRRPDRRQRHAPPSPNSTMSSSRCS